MGSDWIINGTRIGPGESASLSLQISRLPTHTLIDMPFFVFRGKKDGPTLLLTAGLHGDEVNGTEILRRMIREKQCMPQAGAVIAVPLVNVYGFIHGTRDLPDGKDLNRSFPGSKTGSLANRIAHELMNEILPHVDFGVDFHTGGARRTNFPQVRCELEDDQSVELAKAFGAPFTMHSKVISKSFRKEAGKLGKPVIVYEGGESMRLDDHAIQEGMDGLRRLMSALKMKRSSLSPKESVFLGHTSWVRARIAGMFRPVIDPGALVQKGELLATLADPYGETERKVRAPHTGYVIGLNNAPVVNAGDALLHIGH